MACTTRADASLFDQRVQQYWSRGSRGISPVGLATESPSKSEDDNYYPPCSSTPDGDVPYIDSGLDPIDARSTTVPISAIPPEVCSPLETAQFPDAATSEDGGQRSVHPSQVKGSTAEVLEEAKKKRTGTASEQLERMSREQSDTNSRSESVDDGWGNGNRSISTSASVERHGTAASEGSSALKCRNNSSSTLENGSTWSKSGRSSQVSNDCSTVGSLERSTGQSAKTRRNNYSSSRVRLTPSGGGKRYEVVSRSTGSWRQRLQPLRHDVCHFPCSNTHGCGKAITCVQPKCGPENTVYKIAPLGGVKSTSISSSTSRSQPLQGPGRTAMCSRCPQLDGFRTSDNNFIKDEAAAAASTGQLKTTAEATSREEHNAAGEVVAEEEMTGTTSTVEDAAQKSLRSASVHRRSISKITRWFANPYLFSLASSTADQGTVSPMPPTSTTLPVSVSYPQLSRQEGVVVQDGTQRELAGIKDEDIIRKKSSYLNVSLNSLCDELTLISYNIQMLVDCCSLNVNWWTRERRLVQYVRKIAKERNADVIVFQECWSGTSQRLIRSLAKSENGVAFPFQTHVLGADNGPPCYRRAWGDCYCTMGECCRDWRPPSEDDPSTHCLCCRGCCCCCCCFDPLFAGQPSKGRKDVRSHGKQEQQGEEKAERDSTWTSVTGAFSRARRSGGVLIISKWPLVERHAYVYKHGALPDCLENKGAVLVRVNKCGRIFNVVGTHLQSGYSNSHVRLAQFRELAAWLRSGMEACEQEEFFSAEADTLSAPQGAPANSAHTADARKNRDVVAAATATAAGGEKGGGGRTATGEGSAKTSAPRNGKKKNKRKKKGLPPDLIKPHEPLIICGDLNTPFLEDRDILMEALRADCLNCRLCFSDLEHVPTSYDTVLNSTCAARKLRLKETHTVRRRQRMGSLPR